MINKIVLISSVRILENDLKRFDIKTFAKKIDYQIWDLSHFIYKTKIKNLKINKKNRVLKIFKKEDRFIKNLKKLDSNSLVIDLFEIIFMSKYQKIIFSNKVKTMKLNLGPIPAVQRNLYSKFFELINNHKYYTKNIFKKYLINNYFAPNYYICVSKFDLPFYVNSKTKIIYTHSFDFDKTIKEEKYKIYNKRNEKLAIYLDEGIYGHPDLSYNNLKEYCDENIFFSELNNFFHYLLKNNYKIIVAGHPKIHYSKKLKRLFKYKIIEGLTNRLISKSEIVLTHMSTSINFAVLNKKKILHLDSSSYNERLRKHIKTFSNYVGSPIINLKKREYQYNFSKNNNKKLNDYKKRFITPFEYNHKRLWQIVIEKIQLDL